MNVLRTCIRVFEKKFVLLNCNRTPGGLIMEKRKVFPEKPLYKTNTTSQRSPGDLLIIETVVVPRRPAEGLLEGNQRIFSEKTIWSSPSSGLLEDLF